jgi:hypothetical protein
VGFLGGFFLGFIGRVFLGGFFIANPAYTRFFLLFMLILLRKMAPNFEHVKRAADSSIEPKTGSVTSFNVIPPKKTFA